jgi:aldehyde dehydrogenase (NAD+)
MSGAERGRIMRRFAALLAERADGLAAEEVHDNGKPFRETSATVRSLADWYYYFAGAADKVGGRVIGSAKSSYHVYTLQEPVGVVAAITPWNAPLFLLTFKLAPALAAGCTFVLKPASETPVSALGLGELIAESGIPDGVVNIVTGRGSEIGEPLVAHPGVDKIAFTGSTETGIRIAHLAADHLARVSLELGGKSANIVFEDADLDAAASGVVAGIFAASGQSCIAGSRLLVHHSVHDQLVDRVVARARSIVLGDPMDPLTEIGPIAFRAQQLKVLEYIEIGLREGAQLAVGGGTRPDLGPGFFVEPTVLTGVNNGMRVAREEIFGPVLSVIPFESDDEAVAIANDSPYGIAAGIWTNDLRRPHQLARRLRVGTIWVNAYRVLNYDVPFGGLKQSGHGRENGLEGLESYLETKSVWIELAGESRDPFRLG